MKKSISLIVVICVGLFVWSLTGLEVNNSIWFWRKQLIYLSGFIAFVLMSLVMLLAIRPRWLEARFNGLDKLYRLHKLAGIWAIVFSLLHYGLKLSKPLLKLVFAAEVKTGVGAKAVAWFDGYRGIAKDLGEWTAWFLAGMLVITLWQRFPYHVWRYAHKLMAAAYLILLFHAVVLMPAHWWAMPASWLIVVVGVIGACCAAVSLLGKIGTVQQYTGQIQQLRQLPSQVLEVVCALPQSWQHQPGQFAFVKFAALPEAHPFTLSNAATTAGVARFSIKVLGDYSARLSALLKVGQKVQVEGPYGCFTPRLGDEQPQLWIAGGIGITPFVAWLEALQAQPETAPQATLYYCVACREQAPYLEHLEHLASQLPSIQLRVHTSDTQGRLTADTILQGSALDTPIWFCGPEPFARSIQQEMQRQGRSLDCLHLEYFKMR